MLDRDDKPISVGDRVRVVPKTTTFNSPHWLIRSKGEVVSLARKRVKVRMDDTGGYETALYPYDLEVLTESFGG